MSSSRQKQEATPLPLVFTAQEAAEYLRFSESTILRLAGQGFIPGAKIGRQWRFSRETILNLLNQPELLRVKK